VSLPCAGTSSLTGVFVRGWAIKPGWFEASKKWAKTDIITNIHDMLETWDLPWFII
jgi:hypothetical protein